MNQEKYPELADLLNQGMTYREISARLGITYQRVHQIAIKTGLRGISSVRWEEIDQQRIREALANGLAGRQICGLFPHISEGRVLAKARLLRKALMLHPPRPSADEIRNLRTEGMTWPQIARHLSVSTNIIKYLILKEGKVPPELRGERRPCPENCRQVAELLAQNLNFEQIGVVLGISGAAVGQRAKRCGLQPLGRESRKQPSTASQETPKQ